MTARRAAVVLVIAIAAYMVLGGYRAFLLIADGRAVPVVLGIAVLVIPAVVGYLVWREVRFGIATQEMGRQLAAEGALPVDEVPRLPSGRADRDAADVVFQRRRAEVEAAPDDWRGWYRLALAYDDARDRKRAREAARHAIALRTQNPEHR